MKAGKLGCLRSNIPGAARLGAVRGKLETEFCIEGIFLMSTEDTEQNGKLRFRGNVNIQIFCRHIANIVTGVQQTGDSSQVRLDRQFRMFKFTGNMKCQFQQRELLEK